MKDFSFFTDVFFWDEVRKENTNFNFRIIEFLFKVKKTEETNGGLLNKPILILLVSVIECILYDLIKKIGAYTYQNGPIPGIDEDDIKKAKKHSPDRFEKIINFFQTLPHLLEINNQTYGELHRLRKLRNRIHIQILDENIKREEQAWTENDILSSGNILKCLLEILCSKYVRSHKEAILDLSNFYAPWL